MTAPAAASVDATGASFTGAIASPHALATEAGLNAFRDGGTAIDAAIAAAAVLTVVYPHNVALGGDLIALVREPNGAVHCINSSGWAPRDIDVATLRATFGRSLPARDVNTVTVPGGVRGWEALRSHGSRLSWSDTLAAAEDAAAQGVPLAPSVSWHLLHPENADLHGTTDFDRVFRPDGKTLRAGDLLRQKALATSFARLRADGPDAFYQGELAARSVDYLRSRGSCLTPDDFAEFRPEVTAPLETTFGDLTVLTSPPNTHGFILLRVLRAIEELGLADPLGEDFGTVMRLFHRANRLRDDSLADPRHVDVDVDALLHDDLTTYAPIGQGRDVALIPHGDTVGVSAMDSDGCAVSLIQSVFYAFGSGLIDPETGILFHNRGTSFSLDDHTPNVIAPRKRPAHTLMPAMTLQDGRIRHILSTMGGQGQPQILAQILLHATRGATAQAAVVAPRGIVGPQYDGVTDDSVSYEADSPPATRESLIGSGLFLLEVPARTEALGQANVVFAEPDGRMSAASDPRSDGAAAVAHYPRAIGPTS
ncbi:gamma-glutamyltransferase family protein [Mycolicibacterium brisbanense]|uniref:Gamma-glutamyltranspeptidase n=1 Tax=Mycolicibacterium brisbanense TaxID=146020 RepID=A0A100W6A9_9MYCO|nr:gamma-glutamyltransferase [Mycolicibacterium brisbanense]MCV7159620.1 gamma-glutamyltransferase [Mycolicibacterium brisbanense]GAS92414.1 gamma-glutamyltranspeptidase [Mycolicibacterium brisbanense]